MPTGLDILNAVLEKAKTLTEEEYEELYEEARHRRGPNGEPSYYEQVEMGFVGQPIERHGVFINAVYRHYKGKEYLVEDIVADCETCELVVIYEALYKNAVSQKWSRKLASFVETLPNGVTKRFELKNAAAVTEAIGEAKQ